MLNSIVIVVLVLLVVWMAFTDGCATIKDMLVKGMDKVKSLAGSVFGSKPEVAVAPAAAPAVTPTTEGFSDVMSPLDSSVGKLAVNDYNSATQKMALEDGIFSSHQKFATELNKKTSTSSQFIERDDPNDIVPWVGLRKPRYQTRASPEADARVTSSEDPSQMQTYRPFML